MTPVSGFLISPIPYILDPYTAKASQFFLPVFINKLYCERSWWQYVVLSHAVEALLRKFRFAAKRDPESFAPSKYYRGNNFQDFAFCQLASPATPVGLIRACPSLCSDSPTAGGESKMYDIIHHHTWIRSVRLVSIKLLDYNS